MLDEIVYQFNEKNNTLKMNDLDMPVGVVSKFITFHVGKNKHRVFIFEDGSALEVGVDGSIFKAGKEWEKSKIESPELIQ